MRQPEVILEVIEVIIDEIELEEAIVFIVFILFGLCLLLIKINDCKVKEKIYNRTCEK